MNIISKVKTQQGFTLIELLVVIAIIAFLASIVMVLTLGARASARDAARTANISQMTKALDFYYSDHQSYPTGTYYSGWDDGQSPLSDKKCWCTDATAGGGLEQALAASGYMATLPRDTMAARGTGQYLADGAGRGFLFVSDGQNYVIGTYLETSKASAPAQDAVAVCRAAGNYQVSEGTLPPCYCPNYSGTACASGGGGDPAGIGSGSGSQQQQQPQAPTVTNLSPNTGASSTLVTVTGTGFTTSLNSNTINFGAVTINNVNSSDGVTMQFYVPNVAAGVYQVSVTNANGSSNALPFTVTAPLVCSVSKIATVPTVSINPQSLAIQNNLVAVGFYQSNGIQFFDITNPANTVATSSVTSGNITNGITMSGSYAYAVDYGNILEVYNISNPKSPSLIKSFTAGVATQHPDAISVFGNYAYVVSPTLSGVRNLQIINITTPANPSLMGTAPTGFSPTWITTKDNNYAYVANSAGQLQIFNVSNPSSPSSVQTVNTTGGGSPTSVALLGNYMYITNTVNGKIDIYDITAPTTPGYKTPLTTTASELDSISIQGNYLVAVSNNDSKLFVYSLTNPLLPTLVGSISSGGTNPKNVVVLGNYVYVLNYNSQNLVVFQISNCP